MSFVAHRTLTQGALEKAEGSWGKSPNRGRCFPSCQQITAVCSFAGSTAARSPTCATAVVSGSPRRARSPTTCVATQGRSPTCVTPAEKPLLSRVLSSPIPENIQVRGDGGNLCPGMTWECPLVFSSSFFFMFFPFDSTLGSPFSHWTSPLFYFNLFFMCIMVYILK